MQLYVLDRARNALATTALQYNDLHHMELGAGASTYVFTLNKHDENGVADPAAQYLVSGNLVVLQDDKKVPWAFTIMSVEEKHDTITATCADVGIELYNKACDAWAETDAHPFEYYFDECTDGTPWELGINQLSDLSRKLVYTGRDTGLGRLLSVLKGFDDAECKFRVEVSGTMPAQFIVDVYKQIGTVQENVVLDYGNEVNEITRTESRAAFVTALQGVGGVVEQKTDDTATTPATTDTTVPEVHIDFKDLEYDQDGFYSPKGDPMLYAVTANKQFNPGQESYIENFYDYDTQSASELLNRTLSQLKTLSEPQLTFNVEAKVIDPTLEIGDTVSIVDHSYQPALYLSARVATLERSYSDPSKNTITFTNYAILTADDQLRELQNIVNQMPTTSTINTIVTNVVNATTKELQEQVVLALQSANGKSTIYWDAKPATAQNGDIAFIKNADGATEIWAFVEGAWKLDIGLATFEDVKKAASAAADAGSQAAAAGQQAIAAGSAAKSAGDFAASAASQATIETASAQSAANSAVDQANLAISQAGFANDAADQAKSAAASAKSDAADALAEATKSFNDAQNAISNATKAMDAAEQNRTTVTGLTTKVDDITGTIQTLATTQSVDKLAGTVTTVENLAQFASDGLKLKADTSTVDTLKGTVNDLKGELDVQADKIAATVTASDVTGMLGNYATQSWSQGQISAAKNEISASVETVKQTVDNLQIGGRNYYSQNTNITVIKDPNSTYVPAVSKTDSDCPNGFMLTGPQSKLGTVRVNNVITSNGWWTVSFDMRGKQHATGTLTIDTCDLNPQVLTVSNDDTWKRYVYTVNVTNFDDKHNFVDFSNINWQYFLIRNFKVEQGNKATDWTPAPEDQATIDWTKSQLDITDKKITAGITTVTNTLNNNIASATANMATTTWTNTQIDAAKTAINLSVEQSITTSENTLNNNIDNATKDMATQTWTKGQLSVTDGSISASVQKLHDAVTGEITTATKDMATQTWTQGKLDLTASTLTSQISSVKDGLTTKYTQLQQTLDGVQVTANNAVTQAQLSLTANTLTNTISGVNDTLANLSTRNYYQVNTQISVLTGAPVINHNETVNGFKITGISGQLSSVRVKNVITSNGWWTFSFDLHANQATSIIVDFCDLSLTTVKVTKDVNRCTVSINVTNYSDVYNFIDISNLGWANFWFDNVTVQKGKADLGWTPAPEDQATQSQFTQLQSDINLRVKTGDLINQINVSTEGILIDGSKTHITNTTTIDTGVIKSANIQDAAITTAKIGSLAVNTAQIADAAINSAKIASLAVGTAQIADGAISSAKIGNAAITSAQIADASILDAKIASLDGGKIVAGSITADKLSADAIMVGLNNGGYGWAFTPEHLGFFQSGASAPSLQLDPTGIVFADVVSMRKLGINYGGPYSVGVDKSYSGIITQMTYGGADFWGVNVEESGGANWNPIMYSRKQMDTFGIFSGLNISAATHFNTIGPMDADAKAQMKVVRAQVGGRWSTGFMNSNANGGNRSGILFTDDGATYLGRAGKWYNLADIVNKIGIA